MIPYVAYHQASPVAPLAKPVRVQKPKDRKVPAKRPKHGSVKAVR